MKMNTHHVITVDSPFMSEDQSNSVQSVPDAQPVVPVSDLGVTRGNGAFEVIHGVNNKLIAFEAHFNRMQDTCQRLFLPTLNLEAWKTATQQILAATESTEEFALRYVVTAGGDYGPQAWIRYEPVHESVVQQRSEPIAVKSFDRGLKCGEAQSKPWLLHGVKSLSYASNMITVNYAREEGFDDALFVSSDGIVLEGTTASFIALKDGKLYTTEHDAGILPGTTQVLLYKIADQLGVETRYANIAYATLADFEAVWLTSAVRLVTPLRRIDDIDLRQSPELTAKMNAALLGQAERVVL